MIYQSQWIDEAAGLSLDVALMSFYGKYGVRARLVTVMMRPRNPGESQKYTAVWEVRP